MDHQEVELLAIGAGPSNLALAVAVEELAPADLASATVVVEQHDSVAWQRGMLLPWTQSQVSFLKDLVTLRNPRSKFSFVNYLHTVGRLNEFINMGSFLPFRVEISNYLQWVAESLSLVRTQYGRRCTSITPCQAADGSVGAWLVQMADGSTYEARNVVLGVGRGANIPEAFQQLPPDRVIHSSQYAQRVAELDPAAPRRVVVIGAAQSAAEMLWETHQRMPNAQCTMVIRSVGLNYYQTSKFTNELYFPSFTDEFYAAEEPARQDVLRAMRWTNYAGVTPDMLNGLFRQIYLEQLTGKQRLHMMTLVDVVDAKMDDGEIVLRLTDRLHGTCDELRCDVVMLGTGFAAGLPKMVVEAAAQAGAEQLGVTRNYRMVLPEHVTAGFYLQGVNEETHGIADSLISVLAIRAGEIVHDVLAHRTTPTLLASVAAAT